VDVFTVQDRRTQGFIPGAPPLRLFWEICARRE